jgi:hypothetical protein
VHFSNDEEALLAMTWANDREKTRQLDALRLLFRDTGVTAYALWSECWLAEHVVKAGEQPPDPDKWKGVMPRDDPGRIDALVIVGAEKGKPAAAIRTYRLTKDGRGGATVALIEDGPDEAAGRLAELLK